MFRAARAARVDGVHLHLRVELDAAASIDALAADTTWSTTFVRVSRAGVEVAEGGQIVCECEALFDRARPAYRVRLEVLGEEGDAEPRRLVGEFSWEGG